MIALVEGTGTKVVEYYYDAWGKLLSKTGTLAGTLGTLNPFRYRGYVYDEETGLYYLRSRYYWAERCRFVNADIVTKENMYSYCYNSPMNYSDSNGETASNITPYGDNANCFAYALRLEYDPRTLQEFDHKPQPGEFSDPANAVNLDSDKWLGRNEFANKVIDRAMCDASVLGMKIEQVKTPNYETTDRSWVIALATSYHSPKWDVYIGFHTIMIIIGGEKKKMELGHISLEITQSCTF